MNREVCLQCERRMCGIRECDRCGMKLDQCAPRVDHSELPSEPQSKVWAAANSPVTGLFCSSSCYNAVLNEITLEELTETKMYQCGWCKGSFTFEVLKKGEFGHCPDCVPAFDRHFANWCEAHEVYPDTLICVTCHTPRETCVCWVEHNRKEQQNDQDYINSGN